MKFADVINTINGLTTQADNVEADGHLTAARHMRAAADYLVRLSFQVRDGVVYGLPDREVKRD